MELYQIRYAVAVGKLHSFTRAAEEIPVSVASVSEAVRALEANLGVALFERTTRKVWPTPAGEIFLEQGTRLLAGVDALRRELEPYRGLRTVTVALGTPPTAVINTLPGFLADFRRNYPNMGVRLVDAHSKQLIQFLKSGDLDVSFLTGLPGWLPDDVEACELGRLETGIALAPGHPLACQDCIELTALADLPMVINTPGYALREIALEVCRRAQVRPRIALEMAGAEMLIGLVRAGVGFTILPRSRALAMGLAFVRCVPPPLDRVLAIGWLRGRPLAPAARMLRDEICKEKGWLAT